MYEYGVKNEKNFFCDILGIDEAEYKYIRQMVRLQHFMTSNYGYSYSSLLEMSKSSDDKIQEDFQNWKQTMEDGIGKESEKIKRRNIT